MEWQKKRSAASRRRLLHAAQADLLDADGALQVESVASRADVSVGLIYRHFESKSGLLAAVVEAFYDRYENAVMDANPAPGANWATRERDRTAQAVSFHYGEPLAPLVLSRMHLEPGPAAVEARRLSRYVDLAADNLALGQQRGEIPADLDVRLVGAMVLGGLRQGIAEALGRSPRPPESFVVDQLWQGVVAAVRFTAVQGGEACVSTA